MFNVGSVTNDVVISDYYNYEPLILGNAQNIVSSDRFDLLEESGFYIDFMHKTYGDPGTKIRMRTDYVPLACFEQLSFPLVFNNLPSQMSIKKPKVFLKVVYRFLPKNDTREDRSPITLIHTYELDDNVITDAKLQQSGTFNGYTDWNISELVESQDFPFYADNFDSKVFPNAYMNDARIGMVSSNNLKLRSDVLSDKFASKIVIESDSEGQSIQVGNGADVVAIRQITVNPNVVLLPNSVLRLSSIATNCNVDDILVANDQVLEVCNSGAYLSRATANKTSFTTFNGNQLVNSNGAWDGYSVYPNPAINEINLDVGDRQIDQKEVLSMTGRLLIRQTNNLKKINVGALPQGNYIVKCYFMNELIYSTTFNKY